MVTREQIYSYASDQWSCPLLREGTTTVVQPDVWYFDNHESQYTFTTITSLDATSGNRERCPDLPAWQREHSLCLARCDVCELPEIPPGDLSVQGSEWKLPRRSRLESAVGMGSGGSAGVSTALTSPCTLTGRSVIIRKHRRSARGNPF